MELKDMSKTYLEHNVNRLFKKENKNNVIDDDDLGSSWAVDERKGWSIEELLHGAICNRMVQEIVEIISGDLSGEDNA